MKQALTQAWWAPIAALLAVGDVAMLILGGFTESIGTLLFATLFTLGPAALIAFGLARRPEQRSLGSALVFVGAAVGVLWFWTLILPIVGIVVCVGVVASSLTGRRSPEPSSA